MRRILLLLGTTAVGIALGLAGHVSHPEGFPGTSDIVNALSFALIAVTIGGWMVDLPTPLLHLFGIGGCVFWPVYAVIAQRWMKTGRRWLLLLLLAWCAQGFFRIVFRFWGLMSV